MKTEKAVNLGYKYKLYPTKTQQQILNHQMFIYNQTYNICLNLWQKENNKNKNLPTQLKKYRYEVSLSKKIKPYMVFSDKTLSELLAKSPTNLKELEDINGFGPVKVQEYGAAILEILKK